MYSQSHLIRPKIAWIFCDKFGDLAKGAFDIGGQ